MRINSFLKRLLFTAGFLSIALKALPQIININGPSTSYVGSVETYTAMLPGIIPQNYEWNLPQGGGVFESAGNMSASVRWTSGGLVTYFMEDQFGEFYLGAKTVSVQLPVSNTTFSINKSCNSTTVTRQTNPSSYVDWYWQTSASGTSTALGNGASVTVTSDGPLYLRTRSKTSPYSWSSASQSVGTITVINGLPVAGSIGTSTSICPGDASPVLTSVSAPSGDEFNLKWKQLNGSNWQDVPLNGDGLTYSPGNLSVQKQFKRSVSNLCGVVNSNIVTISMKPVPDVVLSKTTETICSGQSTSAVTLSEDDGISGTTFSWTIAASGISGVTSATSGNAIPAQTLSITSTTAKTAIYQVTPLAGGCTGAPENFVVTVKPRPTVSVSPSSQSRCSGQLMTQVNFQNPNGVPGTTFSWTVNAPNITGESNGAGTSVRQTLSQSTSNNQTAAYTVTATANSCSSSSPATALVTVKPLPTVSATPSSQSVCDDGTTSIILSSLNNVSGTTFSWTVSAPQITGASSGSGTTIAQALSQSTTTNKTATYTITGSANGCTGPAATAGVTVYPPLNAGSVSGSNTICYNTDVPAFTSGANASGGNGNYNYQWQWRSPGGTWANLSGATSTTYNHGTLSATREFRRQVSSCDQTEYTTPVTVSVDPVSNGGTVAPSVEAYGVASGSMTVSGITGSIQKWQSKTGSGTWADIASTSSSRPYANVTATTSYRVWVKSGVCPAVPSDEATVIIHPIPTIQIQGPDAIPPAGSTQLVASSGLYSYQWFRDNQAIAGATAKTLLVKKTGSYKVTVKASSTSPVYTPANVIITSALDQQTIPVNYITTTDFLREGISEQTDVFDLDPKDFSQGTQYFDGLGRSIQSVSLGASPSGRDMVQPVTYDEFGREAVKYLPYSREVRDGRYVPGALAEQAGFYQTSGNTANDPAPFAVTIFEPSPLNRILKQGAPGEAWQPNADPANHTDKTIKKEYSFNTAEEVLQWTYAPSTHRVSAKSGSNLVYYAVNELFVNRTYDEHNNLVLEYIDKKGKTILKRVQATAGQTPVSDANYASTYYVYDDFGQLVCVIPPEAVARLTTEYFHAAATDSTKENFLKRWAFRYRYDARRRMIEKQIPGTGSVYMVYDNRDRLVMTQDGNQRSGTNKNWLFTKYDALNRPVLTGIYEADSVLTQEKMQARVNRYYNELASNNGAWYETYVGDATGNVHGYDNRSFPGLEDPDVYLTVTYYDNYLFKDLFNTPAFDFKDNELSVNGNQPGQITEAFPGISGQITGSKIRMLGDTKSWLRSVNYYDDRYRLVQQIADNPKGHEVSTTVYDFVGKVLRSRTSLYLGQPVEWINLVNVQIQGDMLTGTSTSNWAAGAASSQSLPAGTDGWAEFTVVQRSPFLMFGMADANADAHFNTMNYALYVYGKFLRVYESGVLKESAGNVSPGDVLRVERIDGKVYYKRNGLVVYTSTVPSAGVLFADVSFHNTGAKLSNGRLSNTFTAPVPLTPSSYFIKRFTYDHADRLLETWHQLGGADEILLARNEYNELGQLIDKKLHSTEPESTPHAQRTFKQSVDYRYNIRGWLTSINNASLESNAANDDTEDLFGMELAYQEDAGTGNANPDPALDLRQYNGNISAIKWSNNLGLGDNDRLAYNFSYDPMNRLLAATHIQSSATNTWETGAYDENNLVYDLNGNIKTLQRKSKGALIDDLTYYYGSGTSASNKLFYVSDGVTDAVDKAKGFYDGNVIGSDYSYDINGNMLQDKNKGIITDIRYNHLNLPYQVTKGSGVITYLYDATGVKYGQRISYDGLGQKLTEYIGSWIFENNAPQFLQHDEGRITLVDSKTMYYTDCDNADGFTATANVTLENETINGETYLKVTGVSGMPLTKQGVTPIGGTFNVVEGERYVFKVKGYRIDDGAHLYIEGNGADFIWTGATLSQAASREVEVGQAFTIPIGITEITLGVLWNITDEEGDPFYINSIGFYKITDSAPEYQYHLKDHLGNVRLTFTTKEESDHALATLETANASAEQGKFLNYNEAVLVHSDIFDHTNNNPGGVETDGYATRLTGASTNKQYGLARSLSVMPGDTVKIGVYAKYIQRDEEGNWPIAVAGLMDDITANVHGVVIDGGQLGSLGSNTFPFIGLLDKSDEAGTPPKAYLNYLVFNRQDSLVDFGYMRTTAAALEDGTNAEHEYLFKDDIVIREPGYVYIYLSNENETPVEVFFDDFKVEHVKSPVVQMDDYYPGGATFNSYSRENSIANKRLYQTKELQTDLGLLQYDFGPRQYDPFIWRTTSHDPHSESYYAWSPYSWAFNNPIRYDDPTGKDPGDKVLGFLAAAVDNALGGVTPLREMAASYVDDAADFNSGQDMGDVFSLVSGIMEAESGAGLTTTGVAVTVGSGGLASKVGVPAAGIGLAMTAHGAMTSLAGGNNLINQKGRLNAEGKNGGSFGAKQDTKSATQKESFNKAKDQNGVPRSQQPDKVTKVKENGTGKNLREYQYTNSKGEKVSIRRDNAKQYNDGGKGDQGKHHNAGSTGQKLKQHHDY